MKKSLILMAAAAMLLAGCTKEMDSPVNETPLGMKTITLKASYDSDLTKTTYEGDKTLSWTTGDKIGVGVTVNDQIQTVAFELTDGAGTPSGTFTGEIPEDGELTGTAFYPWNGEQTDDPATGGSNVGGDGNIYFHQFPETAWVADSAPLLLAAQFDDPNAIVFKQAAGAMKVTLKEVPADADKLVLTVNDKVISGWFALDPENIGEAAITSGNSGTGASQLAYTFATADADRDMTFYFPLPAIELPSFNIELFAGNASLWSMASTKSRTITRGKILRMPELTVEVLDRTFFLVGYIGGADYYGNDYKFDEEGNLDATFPEGNNYVYVKRGNGGDGRNYYFSEYCEATTGTIWRYNDGQGEKMLVPGAKKLVFTLVQDEENPDKMTLSYEEYIPTLKIEKLWEKLSTASENWFVSIGASAGTDFNIAIDNENVYIPEFGNSKNLWAIDIATGNTISKVNTSTVESMGFDGSIFLSCARVVKKSDGTPVLMATNLFQDDNSNNPTGRLYIWENGIDQAPAVKTMQQWGAGRRLGDTWTTYGSYEDCLMIMGTQTGNGFVTFQVPTGSTTYLMSRLAIDTGDFCSYYPFPGELTKGMFAWRGGNHDDGIAYRNRLMTIDSTEAAIKSEGAHNSTLTKLDAWMSNYENNNGSGFNFFEFNGKRYVAWVINMADSKTFDFVVKEGAAGAAWDSIINTKAADITAAGGFAFRDSLVGGQATTWKQATDCAVWNNGNEVYIAVNKINVGIAVYKMYLE